MPRTRPPYPGEFRRQMVELGRAGRTPEKLAREFEPSAQTIRNWAVQLDRDEGRRTDGLTTEERGELGYGDFQLATGPARWAVCAQLMSGILLLVVAFPVVGSRIANYRT